MTIPSKEDWFSVEFNAEWQIFLRQRMRYQINPADKALSNEVDKNIV